MHNDNAYLWWFLAAGIAYFAHNNGIVIKNKDECKTGNIIDLKYNDTHICTANKFTDYDSISIYLCEKYLEMEGYFPVINLPFYCEWIGKCSINIPEQLYNINDTITTDDYKCVKLGNKECRGEWLCVIRNPTGS